MSDGRRFQADGAATEKELLESRSITDRHTDRRTDATKRSTRAVYSQLVKTCFQQLEHRDDELCEFLTY